MFRDLDMVLVHCGLVYSPEFEALYKYYCYYNQAMGVCKTKPRGYAITKPQEYAIQHIPVRVPSQNKLGGLQLEGHLA